MRHLKLILMIGLILAVSGTAGAIKLVYRNPANPLFGQTYYGPVTLKFSSWDMGTIYPAGPTATGIGAVNALPQFAPPGTAYDAATGAAAAPGSLTTEDGWGIYELTTVFPTGSGNTFFDQLWAPGLDGTEIVGMFYGLVDNAVGVGGAFGQIVQSEMSLGSVGLVGLGQYDMYEQPVNTFALAGGAGQGSGGRTGFATYNGLTGGLLIVSGYPIPGIGSLGTPFDEFYADVNPIVGPPPTAFGSFDTLIELDPNVPQRDYVQFNSDTRPNGADLEVHGTTKVNDGSMGDPTIGDWTVVDEDPIRGNVVIPEPVTLLGVCMGVVGLGGYVRRRRLA